MKNTATKEFKVVGVTNQPNSDQTLRKTGEHLFADCGGVPKCVTCGCDEDDAFVGGEECSFEARHLRRRKTQIIRICVKCCDAFAAALIERESNESGSEVNRTVGEYAGYVPNWMPGEHYGDFVELDIDPATGKILNWKKPTQKQLKETFDKKQSRD